MKPGITQKDIARRLGISQALVSRALTGTSAAIAASPATVERIRAAAAEWGYTPNAAALSLKGAPTRTLGVIVKDFNDPFFGHLIGILQGLAQRQHYGLLLVGWNETLTNDPAADLLFRKYQPDGLMVCGSDYSPPSLAAFLDRGKPVVQIGLGKTLSGVHQVGIDERAGLQMMVRHLRKLGHERIGYIGLNTIPQKRREAALDAALRQEHLTVRRDWFMRAPTADTITAAMRTFLATARNRRPTALVAADDATAQTVLRALHEHGIPVPGDLSLTGFDDIPAARAMIPALTSVRQPLDRMGEEAFRLASGAATEPVGSGARIVVTPQLVVRESSGAPPSKG